MNILVIDKTKLEKAEIQEFAHKLHHKFFMAKDLEQAIKITNTRRIDVIIIFIHSLTDIGILEYFNKNFQNIKILVHAEKQFNDIFSTIQTANYIKLKTSFDLNELKNHLKGFEEGGGHI